MYDIVFWNGTLVIWKIKIPLFMYNFVAFNFRRDLCHKTDKCLLRSFWGLLLQSAKTSMRRNGSWRLSRKWLEWVRFCQRMQKHLHQSVNVFYWISWERLYSIIEDVKYAGGYHQTMRVSSIPWGYYQYIGVSSVLWGCESDVQ